MSSFEGFTINKGISIKKPNGRCKRLGGKGEPTGCEFLCTDCQLSPEQKRILNSLSRDQYLIYVNGEPVWDFDYETWNSPNQAIEILRDKLKIMDNNGNYIPYVKPTQNQAKNLKEIEKLELLIKEKKNTIAELYSDTSIIPSIYERLEPNDPRCPKECGRFGGYNLHCRNRCDQEWYRAYDQQVELRNLAIRKHIQPLQKQITNYENQIALVKEKYNLPYLRNDLIKTTAALSKLDKDDPFYRQKKSDLSEEILIQAQKLDEQEKKHGLYGNIPSVTPELKTPEPIVQTSVNYEVNKTPLLILGALGLVGLFLIWRLK
jgi:hypothetical protein